MSDANPVSGPSAPPAAAPAVPVPAAPLTVATAPVLVVAPKVSEVSKIEADVKADEVKAKSWIVKHPDATVAILAGIIIALFVIGMKLL